MQNSKLAISLAALGLTEDHFDAMKKEMGVEAAVTEVSEVQERDIQEEVERIEARRKERGTRHVEVEEDFNSDEELYDMEAVSPFMRAAFGE